jgi:large subunit ribosomal protein L24
VSIARVRKNDIVAVMRGKDAGKTGKVLFVDTAKGRVVVEGLNLVKKALRKSQDNPKGGIVDKEASIHAARLMPYCPHCKKGVRIKRAVEDGKRVRKCRRCGHTFES